MMQNFNDSLLLMAQGMGGIFLVMVVIAILVALIGYFGSKKK